MKKARILLLILAFVILLIIFTFYWLKLPKNLPKQISPEGMQNGSEQAILHRFVYFGDSRGVNNGVNAEILNEIFQQIKMLNPQPEYIIVGGDLVVGSKNIYTFNSQLLNFKKIATAYYPSKKILPAIGNHEMVGSNNGSHEKTFENIFSEFTPSSQLDNYCKTVYYVDDGNVRLIVLNSFHTGEYNQISPTQQEWLKQVSVPDGKIKFVFLHSPAYPTGADIGAALDQRPKLRDGFWKVADQNNIMAVFCGHEHNYSRRLIDNTFSTKYATFTRPVYQIVAGGGGAPLYKQYKSSKGIIVPPTAVYHYVVMDVGKNNTLIKAFSLDGQLIDDFSLKNVY